MTPLINVEYLFKYLGDIYDLLLLEVGTYSIQEHHQVFSKEGLFSTDGQIEKVLHFISCKADNFIFLFSVKCTTQISVGANTSTGSYLSVPMT